MIERMWGSIHRTRLAGVGVAGVFLRGAGPLGAQEAEGGAPEVRRVRTIDTARLGIRHPAGLAFSRRANRFVVLAGEAGAAPTELQLLETEGHQRRGLALGTPVPDPLNATFDNKAHRLVFYDARRRQLVEVNAGRDGVPDVATLTRHALPGPVAIVEAAGMSADPVTGRLFVLDAVGPRLVAIEPEFEGGLRGAQVSVYGLAGLPEAPLRGLAFDPASGNLHAYQPETARLYEVTPTGRLVANRDLAPAGLGETRAMVFAPSGDGTDDPARTTLYVAEVGAESGPKTRRIGERASPARAGRITEVTIAPEGGSVIAASSVTATLVQVIDTSQFNPPSPDAMGIAFVDEWGTLLMSDSEVNEIPALFTGENLFEVDPTGGTLLSTASAISYSDEPVGVAYDPVTPRIFISDDTGGDVYLIERGPDNTFFTNDDDVTELSVSSFGSGDPEGITFHRGRRSIFIADGVDAQIYEWDPGPNEQFGDGDDVMNDFDTSSSGAQDPEGITYDTASGNLYVCGTSSTELFEFTPTGTLVRTIDISAADPPEPSGLAFGPNSENPALASVYITDRGVDNGSNPEENDGQIFEVTFGGSSTGNLPPIVSAGPDLTITLPDTAFLDGDVMDDPTQTLTIQWSEVSGPGTVDFSSPNSEDTDASFSAPGTYVVRLTADDGELSSSDDATVTVNPDPGPGGISVIDVEVTAESDDAEEDESGAISLGSTDLELVHEGSDDQVVGIRFASVPLPPGAIVTTAYLQFQTDEIDTVATALTIRAQAADDPPTFTSATGNISSRPTTAAASPTWNPVPWNTPGEAGPDQRSTTLTAVLNEIVARPGWASGNAVVFIVTGTGVRTAESENGDGGPTLHVEYSTGTANMPPVVTIASPANGAMFNEGASIGFAGSAIDPEDGDISADLSWTSSLDGSIGMGASFSRSDLTPGTHVITASATDSGGVSGSDEVTIEVIPDNDPPVVTISSPANGAMFNEGTSIGFAGTAIDPEDGDISANLDWTSDIDGSIGSGASFSTSALSAGTHLITASVVDSGGASGSDEITIEVIPDNSPPVVTITSPASGAMFTEGTSVGFAGTAIDPEDGDISADLDWTSDIDGSIGSGASFSTSGLSVGVHLITAMVVDSGGAGGSDEVTIEVLATNAPPVVTITSPANGASFTEGDSISFAGTAIDPEDGDISASLSWTSSIDGAIGTGASFSRSDLTAGTHLITAMATDSGGVGASDQITIQVLPTNPSTVVIDLEVVAGNDDAEEDEAGAISRGSSDLELIHEGQDDQIVGIRYVNVPIPQGASITKAYLQFQVDEIDSDPTSLTIRGQAADDALVFTSTTFDISSRPTTTAASPTWNPAPWTVVGEAGPDQRSTDLSAVLNEIVARPGWTSGNALALIVTGTGVRTAESENGDGGPTLHVEYSTGTPNSPPVVTITSPANGASFTEGDSISFAATAIDPEDGDIGASLVWTSSLDGTIGAGASFSLSTLSVGSHLITAMATDSGGVSGSDQVTIEVTAGNGPPVVTITSPASGASFTEGDSISFAATAIDPEDGDISASLVWTSSLDGTIGAGASFSTSSLSVGSHLITATATDSGGVSGSDQVAIEVTAPNDPPVVTITSPANGAGFNEGDSISFAGTAIDPEDGDISASLAWTSSLDGTIGAGASFSTSSLSAGTHLITAMATDSGGTSGSDQVTIHVNAAPTVIIASPANGTTFLPGDSISFAGSAIDPEDGDISAGLVWTSSLDGTIGAGASFSTSSLSVGMHLVTAAVVDSGGLGGSDQVAINVNSSPTVLITSPANGAGFSEGASVAFAGSASDPEDGDVSASLEWTSSLDGDIGTGPSFSRSDLTPGTHVVTATATDSLGATGSAQVTITVNPNAAPVVTITSPPDEAILGETESIVFTGTAIDPEEGDLSANLTWTSSKDGALGTGASISVQGLSRGKHTITASVTDSAGAEGSDSIRIRISR